MTHSEIYLKEVQNIAHAVDHEIIEKMARTLADLRKRKGRLFFIGVGGSAANSSHAVNDFRKLAGIEAYSPCDNIAELTARTNDEGWPTVFEAWLQTSNANSKDALFVLSVGGGDNEQNISPNIVRALNESKRRGLKIFGIVGRDGGHTKKMGDHVLVIPTMNSKSITPHTESFQAVIWHCLVSNPILMLQPNKWESLDKPK